MATPSMVSNEHATILLSVFDGTRQPIGPGVKNLFVRIIDGNQKQLFSDFRNGASFQFQVPFYDNFGDSYTVIASADHHTQAGATPVNVQRTVPQTVDLMLLDKNATFQFANARWSDLPQKFPEIHSILGRGAATEDDAQARYENLMEKDPATLACVWNLMTAMRDIDLPSGTPLTYLKQLIWEDVPERNIFAPAQDRFYAYLMKLIMGSKTNPDLPQAINVLTFVDRVSKDIDGFRHQYDNLSEFAHPNWAGTGLLYSKSDSQNLWTDFGANIRGVDSTKQVGAVNLSVALMIFERNYNLVADLMPPFVELCESRVKAATKHDPPTT